MANKILRRDKWSSDWLMTGDTPHELPLDEPPDPAYLDDEDDDGAPKLEILAATVLALGLILTLTGFLLAEAGVTRWVFYAGLAMVGMFGIPAALRLCLSLLGVAIAFFGMGMGGGAGR
jgi:hypothetical protein